MGRDKALGWEWEKELGRKGGLLIEVSLVKTNEIIELAIDVVKRIQRENMVVDYK